jgi:hypothetical protein
MTETTWSPLMIEERFAEAADVMKRLPEVRVPGYFSTWPKALQEFSDLVGQEPPRLYRPPPGSEAIGRMEEVLDWLFWLEANAARVVFSARCDDVFVRQRPHQWDFHRHLNRTQLHSPAPVRNNQNSKNIRPIGNSILPQSISAQLCAITINAHQEKPHYIPLHELCNLPTRIKPRCASNNGQRVDRSRMATIRAG